ncbi:ankyrin repeat and protein kinase domain-containing protein 1 [Fagus crenata]
MENAKKHLFKIAMQGKWEKVVEIYKTNPMAHKAKLTVGDTALHMSRMAKRESRRTCRIYYFRRENKEIKEVLNIKNELGNTPLHNLHRWGMCLCVCIGNVDKSLVGARNHDNETPFFLAAPYGKKEAFLCLHDLCGSENGYNYCRRKDGDTILHCAISGDYFDLAFRIIRLYEDLVNSFNYHGLTPLHILVSKPSSFRSGSHFGGWYKMIYHCIFVDELGHEPSDQNFKEIIIDGREPKKSLNNQKYPKNYRTCFNFLQLFWNAVYSVGVKKKGVRTNTQNLKVSEDTPTSGFKSTNGARHHLFPVNYGTCFEFVKLASKSMLVIFGLGSSGIRKIEEKKQKHTWAVQILNELLQYSSLYEYDYTGANPLPATPQDDVGTIPYDVSDRGDINFASEASFLGDLKPKTPTADTLETKEEEKNIGTGGNDKTKEAKKKKPEKAKKESPILIAAKNGITEIVEEILELFPVAIHDMNEHKKNIVLLAVENRQPHVYQLLLRRNVLRESVFRRVDHDGFSTQKTDETIPTIVWTIINK